MASLSTDNTGGGGHGEEHVDGASSVVGTTDTAGTTEGAADTASTVDAVDAADEAKTVNAVEHQVVGTLCGRPVKALQLGW